jgi:O-antigen/teichoic acid export membrane protein
MAAARGDRGEARRVVLRSLGIGASLGLVWSVACVLGRDLFVRFFHVPGAWVSEVERSLLVFALSLLLYSTAQVLQWTLMGFQRFDLSNLSILAGLGVNTGVLVAGLAAGWGLLATAVGATAGQLVACLVAAAAVRGRLARLVDRADAHPGTTWKDLLGFGALVQVSNMLAFGQGQIGKVILGALGRLASVTQFEFAYRVTTALWALSALIQGAAYPAAAHAREVGGADAVRDVYDWICRWVFAVASWLLGALWLIAPPLFVLWLGEPNPTAASVTRWMALAAAMGTLGGPATAVARGAGAPGLEALHYGIAFGANLLLGLWLIPRLGPDGAAISMAVSFALASLCLLLLLHRRLGVSSPAWMLRLAAPRLVPATLLAGLLGLAFSGWSVDSRAGALVAVGAQGLAFTILYAALTWATGDPGAVWARGRSWMARLGVGPA